MTRGAYRLTPNQTGTVTFQLFGNGYRFAPGHRVRLELLGRDAPYLRPSNGTFAIAVSNLELRLPVHERPGGQVLAPAAPVLLVGATPAP